MDIQTIMAATVHDVKNSLGLIDSQLNDVIKRLDGSDPGSAQEIRLIQLECNRINNGMVHMLGFYKLDQGTFSPNFAEAMVADVVVDATSRYTEMLLSLGVSLSIHFPDGDEECVWYLDANLIEGLLGNIVTNSIRYTKSQLAFDIAVIDGWLNIRMSDDGGGFPKAMLTLLDQPEQLSFQSGATGLGLYFCQEIAKLHTNEERKGFISLDNNEQTGGAIFNLWLP
ncbi:HAMP domain-containing sensor histidine kinase [Reinekea sp.]|jgi:K+-sensing histidine kinase KdpD|uniref:sensor histidine kinase n=1 Tax=Reinekea sp. TaxID=1970455 RepID=UPI002A834376|nr:HAMP domain-containing sensor histidine kinase [Reinekea sp.]